MADPPAPGTVVEPAIAAEARLAPRYKVLIHNDAVTPMDYVVEILTGVFRRPHPQAIAIMLEAHNADVALVVVLGFEQAEHQVDQAHSLARTRKYPLTFSIEAA